MYEIAPIHTKIMFQNINSKRTYSISENAEPYALTPMNELIYFLWGNKLLEFHIISIICIYAICIYHRQWIGYWTIKSRTLMINMLWQLSCLFANANTHTHTYLSYGMQCLYTQRRGNTAMLFFLFNCVVDHNRGSSPSTCHILASI